MKKNILLIILVFAILQNIHADGLMLPINENYPKDFLHNKSTEITVNIKGLIAKTIVRQEFTNEWNQAVDAVYSFPLPADARAIDIFYWRNDSMFRAVLKVRQQSVNPGTGDGGVAGLVNQYMGKNAIRIELKEIPAYGIQRVEIHYVSLLDYYYNESTYTYPLDTRDFVTYPLDYLKISFNVESKSKISSYEIPSHQGFNRVNGDDNSLHLELAKSKAYIATDLVFKYTVEDNALTTDFYSAKSDTTDGYFNLFVRSPKLQKRMILGNKLVFLMGNSNRMTGYKIEQAIEAISESLDNLRPYDMFNIILFNYSVSSWKSNLVEATAENINEAKAYLKTISTEGGSNMDAGIKEALSQFTQSTFNNAILAFTDGYTVIDPIEVADMNQYNTGIFIAGIGEDIDRKRLEMTATYNHGFATYLSETNIKQGIKQIFGRIYQPILKNVAIDYQKDDLYALMPQTLPAVYTGSYLMISGRYSNPEEKEILLKGENAAGNQSYPFTVNFRSDSLETVYAVFLWAKLAIDDLEQQIHIYGEDEALKDSVIKLSLNYNIRCRYTAYIADYKNTSSSTDYSYTDDDVDGKTDEEIVNINETVYQENIVIEKVFPNPFAGIITLKMNFKKNNNTKILKIFDIYGKLIACIDISEYNEGSHTITLDLSKYRLRDGIYFIQMQIDNTVCQTLKIQHLE